MCMDGSVPPSFPSWAADSFAESASALAMALPMPLDAPVITQHDLCLCVASLMENGQTEMGRGDKGREE